MVGQELCYILALLPASFSLCVVLVLTPAGMRGEVYIPEFTLGIEGKVKHFLKCNFVTGKFEVPKKGRV